MRWPRSIPQCPAYRMGNKKVHIMWLISMRTISKREAWFTKDGVWQMTETDLRYADLPAPVRSSYESSTYYNVWKVEDDKSWNVRNGCCLHHQKWRKVIRKWTPLFGGRHSGEEVPMRTTAVLPKIISLLIFPLPSRFYSREISQCPLWILKRKNNL